MPITYPNINYAWGSLIIEECIRLGIDYFCIAPGSRSSPLSVSAARHPKANCFVHFDERGLAFHALGYVAATKKPAVLICTSGTAAANFLPAIIEASKKKLPLIVMTADRPPELRFTGSVQTIDQVGIFGKYTVWATDMPCPDKAIDPQVVLTTIDQAVYQAIRRGGVVHLNCMFREPLAPINSKEKWGNYFDALKSWQTSTKPYTEYVTAFEQIRIPQTKAIANRINAIKQGLIIVGKVNSDQERQAIIHLARRLGWPIAADISSGLRLGESAPEVIQYMDHILLTASASTIKIDGVIHVGGRMTSKRLDEFVAKQTLLDYIMVLPHALRNDPHHQVTLRIESSALNFCDSVGPLIKNRAQSKLLTQLIKLNKQIDKTIDGFLQDDGRLSEPAVARLVSQEIVKGSGLFLGNSMPIRDMDMYADFKGATVYVNGNRGASGIDGLIASAIGYAQGLKQPVTLMIGDISALHDLNSLAMLKDVQYPVVIVVLNNGGGGIFSFLPIAEYSDVFEKCFGTPHGVTFANAAMMFELQYSQPVDRDQFTKVYRKALSSTTATIIEIMNSRGDNKTFHRTLQGSL